MMMTCKEIRIRMGMEEWGIENNGHRKDLVFLNVNLVGHEKVK